MNAATRAAWLRCRRCRAEHPAAGLFEGCPACASAGTAQPLEVVYDYEELARGEVVRAWKARLPGLWRFRELLPLPGDAAPVSLAEGGTPLVRLDLPGPGRIWLKDESRNPTGAFKDRFQAVSVSMARALGYRKVTTPTAGNHGTSLAAYAARAGLRCLVFCAPETPDIHRRLMRLYGARVSVLKERREHLDWLVRERGWYPSTFVSPMPIATPYGVEGYKTIAFELFEQLGDRMPGRVVVPVTAGDAIYGPWKGFQELARVGAPGKLPAMIAVQAAGCDPVVRAFRAGAREVGVHPHPRTIATSISGASGGAVSLTAVYESGGAAMAVPDDEILAAVRQLGRRGFAVEPSSAAPLAAVLQLQRARAIADDEDVVCVLTGAAARWPEALREALRDVPEAEELHEDDREVVRSWIGSFDDGS